MTNVVTADSPFKKIVAEIRKQSRALAKKSACKVSVTKEEYSGGRKVYVTITNAGFYHLCPIFRHWQNQNPHSSRCDYPNPRECEPGQVHLADWAIALIDGLKEIVNQYNWDKSDSMTDYFHVNYYSDVDFHGELDKENHYGIDYYLDTHTAEEIAGCFDEIIAKTHRLHDLQSAAFVLNTTAAEESQDATDTTPDHDMSNVLAVDFGSKETPTSSSEPTNEDLRAMLAKLDEERLALQVEVDRARERHELTIKIAEQMASIAALKNELDSLK